MGMNYYWTGLSSKKCEHCGHEESETVHIGKSSGGWCFVLHVYIDPQLPEANIIRNLDDWNERFYQEDSVIRDEMNRHVTPEQMFEIIADRSMPDWTEGLLEGETGAERGPEHLLRSKIGYGGCVGHGAYNGTWDLCTGDFC